jgi:hypothetical protein
MRFKIELLANRVKLPRAKNKPAKDMKRQSGKKESAKLRANNCRVNLLPILTKRLKDCETFL